MPCSPPPFPPLPEIFDQRWKDGARTIRELDPPFAAWLDDQARIQRWQAWTIGVGMMLLVVTVALIVWRQ